MIERNIRLFPHKWGQWDWPVELLPVSADAPRHPRWLTVRSLGLCRPQTPTTTRKALDPPAKRRAVYRKWRSGFYTASRDRGSLTRKSAKSYARSWSTRRRWRSGRRRWSPPPWKPSRSWSPRLLPPADWSGYFHWGELVGSIMVSFSLCTCSFWGYCNSLRIHVLLRVCNNAFCLTSWQNAKLLSFPSYIISCEWLAYRTGTY